MVCVESNLFRRRYRVAVDEGAVGNSNIIGQVCVVFGDVTN